MKPLQSHSKLIEIETRLSKQSYLSRNNLPGSADARIFLFLQSIKRYPDRKLYPNFYHWYILMKQFATSSIEKWISNHEHLEEDGLITDFIAIKQNQKMPTDIVTCFKKDKSQPEAASEAEKEKLVRSEEYTQTGSGQIEYVMDVKIKEEKSPNMKELVTSFLTKEQIELTDLQILQEERRIRIVIKMLPEKYEELKNTISQLEGVQTFECKKKEKKFKTVNSLNSFHGEVREGLA